MGYKLPYTKEQLDYLNEMFNIAAGNAVTAFSQFLNTNIEMKESQVFWLPNQEPALQVFAGLAEEATGARMNMVGDVIGGISFIVRTEDRNDLVKIAGRALMGREFSENKELSLSVVAEIGNILAGSYLNAIFNFCGLRIYHTVPYVEINSIQALIDGLLQRVKDNSRLLVMVHSKFVIQGAQIATYFILASPERYIEIFINSLKDALLRLEK